MENHVSVQIQNAVVAAVNDLYGASITKDVIQIHKTRKEFEGDFTIVVFPLLKISKSNEIEKTIFLLPKFTLLKS